MDGASDETQIIDYTRRGYRGNVAGRGFDPRRLHSRRSHNPAQTKTGSSVHFGEPFFFGLRIVGFSLWQPIATPRITALNQLALNADLDTGVGRIMKAIDDL